MASYTIEDYAVSYVKKFHAIVPTGTWIYKNKSGREVNTWKRPVLKGWASEPLRTEKQVRDFWRREAEYGCVPGIALATGQICGGYIVIDLDRKPEQGIDGWDYLKSWERETGLKLPENTWTTITGSGGYHLYFHTSRAMRSYSNPEIGVDLRADGACAILPPTPHPTGKRYFWEYHPSDFECAEATDAVYRFIEDCRPNDAEYHGSERRDNAGERKMILPPVISDGGRHRALISVVGSLNKLGISDAGIMAVIRMENAEKCDPPLTEAELQAEIFPAIYRWPKGVPADDWKESCLWKTEQRELWRKDQRLRRERTRLGC